MRICACSCDFWASQPAAFCCHSCRSPLWLPHLCVCVRPMALWYNTTHNVQHTHKSIITLVKNRILEVFLLLQPARLCVGQLQGSVCSCCPGFSSAALFGRLCCRHGGGTNAWCRKANWTRMHQGRNGCGAAHVAECTLGHSSEDAQNANNARTHGRGAWHV